MAKKILKLALGLGLLALLCYGVMMVWVKQMALPSFEQVRAQSPSSFVSLLAKDGTALDTWRVDFQQRRLAWTSLDNYSSVLQETLIRSEDKRFYEHHGVDWLAVLHALKGKLFQEQRGGASTLSMQLVGLIVPELQRQQGQRGYTQKFYQILYAQALELTWTKAQILEAYLNLAPLRGELVGMQAGSQAFFQKYPQALNKRESALLVAMLRTPNASLNVLRQRTCALLNQRSCEFLTPFIKNALTHWHAQALDKPHYASHFGKFLQQEYQRQGRVVGEQLPSTIHKPLQQFVQAQVHRRLRELFSERATDAAVVVLDNRHGDILAYVGSSGGLSKAAQVDHARSLRQAGSTLKPFLYAYAFDKKRLTPASLLQDDLLSLSVETGLYIPQNYDRAFKGWVSVRTALASSLNIPAVKTLTMLDVDAFRNLLVDLGLPLSEAGDYYGYSLALGSADVTLLSLTNAYRSLANLGQYSPIRLLTDQTQTTTQIFSPESAWLIAHILSDRHARAMTFGLDSPLSTPFWTAVKTGTSKDMRDNWTVGWSSDYTVGVWVGNSAGQSMQNISGVAGAAPIWHDVMKYLHQHQPSIAPEVPKGVVRSAIQYTPRLEPDRTEYFIKGTELKQVELPSFLLEDQLKISAPTDNTIVAIDPDIPVSYQRLKMQASVQGEVAGDEVYWVLNGEKIGEGNPFFWTVKSGKFHLMLFSKSGKKLDEIHFQVRGLQ